MGFGRAATSLCARRDGRAGGADAEDGAEACAPCADDDGASALARAVATVVGDRRFELVGVGTSDAVVPASDALLGGRADGGAAKRARPSSTALDEYVARVVVGETIHFQLVGAALYGLTRRQLESDHAVDLSALNSTFAQRVNAWVGDGHRPKPFVTAAPLTAVPPGGSEPASLVTVRFVVGGACELERVWAVIGEVADEVMAEAYARLGVCRCPS